jgi:hypothetical protein
MKLKAIGEESTTNPVVKADIDLILEKISASEEDAKLSHIYLNEYMERHREVVCQALSLFATSKTRLTTRDISRPSSARPD